jgi:copper transport protein
VRRALALAAIAALALPATALAHASLQHESPSFRERLQVAPRQVVLRFDQDVSVLPGSIEVLTLKGRNVAGRARAVSHGLAAPLPPLGKGPYTVRWKAVSNDGHVVGGVYTFGVRYPAPPVTDAVGAQGPTATESVVRWLYFLALALLVGGLVFRLGVVRGPLPSRAERRFYRVAGVGAAAVVELGIVAFLLRAEDALQLPFGRFLYGDLSPLSTGTRFGETFIAMTLGFALVSALLYLGWLTERRAFLWPALAIALVFASGLSLSGHSAAEPGSSWATELVDFAHLVAAMVWLGGLAQLVLVVWPAAPEQRRDAFLRFSRLATGCVAVLVVGGTYLSLQRLPHLAELWSSGYGRVLLAKLALVSVALAWGALHHFVARPLLERGTGSAGLLARLPRSLAGESAIALAVLLAAAFLVNAKPPPQPAPARPAASNVLPLRAHR